MKKSLMMAAGVSLFAVGLTTTALNNEVHAATKVTAGKNAKVTHSAYIYNSKGKRVKKASLKKNKTTKVIKIVKIKGKNYAQIGKNQFVKLGNLSGVSGTKKSKKKVSKATSKKNNYKKVWKEKLKGIDMINDYSGCNVKVTALKDTTIKVDYAYDWYKTGRCTGEITFPKGSSVYIKDFEKEGKWLAVTEMDEGGVDEGYYININDVSLKAYNISEDEDDESSMTDLDGLVPQFGEYKKQKYSGINGGEYSLLGLERELTKRGLFKKVSYTTQSPQLQHVLHENDADYQKDLEQVQAYYQANPDAY